MKLKLLSIILALACCTMAVAAPKTAKRTSKRPAKTEQLRVELNLGPEAQLKSDKETTFDKAYKEYHDYQDYNEAVKLFTQAINEGDRAMQATAIIGSIKLEQGDTEGGMEMMAKAIDMMDENTDPSFQAWVCSELSAASLEAGNLQEALDMIDNAVELCPSDAHYVVERAVVKFKLKDHAGAGKDAKLALTLSPEQDDMERAQELAIVCDKLTDAGYTSTVAVSNITEERDTVQTDEAILPEFPGGRKAMSQFIKDNIQYPKKAQKNGVQGTVVVECAFDTEGNMTDSKVYQGVDNDLDKEALRVCRAMPRFTPGSAHGVPMKSSLLIQVKFRINK